MRKIKEIIFTNKINNKLFQIKKFPLIDSNLISVIKILSFITLKSIKIIVIIIKVKFRITYQINLLPKISIY